MRGATKKSTKDAQRAWSLVDSAATNSTDDGEEEIMEYSCHVAV